MKTENLTLNPVSSAVSTFVRRNYETYVKHYQDRNLTPMTFDEFLKNYTR
jgi:hypothetical protein